jgi:glycerol kinase
VVRPADIETTALGAAYAAGLAVGVWSESQIFEGLQKENTTIFHPRVEEDERKKRGESWSRAVAKSFELADLA